MKTTLKVLKFAAIGIANFTLLVVLVSWWSARDRIDTVFISKVDFSSPNFDTSREFTKEEYSDARLHFDQLKEPYFMSNFHWLKEGDKFAILFRSYSDKIFFAIDDEQFSQVTVVVPSIEPGDYAIDGNSIRAFFTKGGSAWPDGQCGAPVTKGNLKIFEHSESKLKAMIQFEVECTRRKVDRREQIKFDRTYTYRELQFKDATGWFGKKDNHIYRETYR